MIPAPWLAGSRNNRLLLNRFPSAVAYSVRRLKGNASLCMRVRRSSDNDEMDIGFNGNLVDVNTAESFCGAGDGYVTVWYNQVNNGASANAYQDTSANQPIIISSGSAIEYGGHPVVSFGTGTTPGSMFMFIDDVTLFKNKSYNRFYITLHRIKESYTSLVLFNAAGNDPANLRVRFIAGSTLGTKRGIYSTICKPDSYGYPSADYDYYFMAGDAVVEDNQWGNSTTLLNVIENWNPASSGIGGPYAERSSRVIKLVDDPNVVTTASTPVTTLPAGNTDNTDSDSITFPGKYNSGIDAAMQDHHFKELIIYSSSTYHNNNGDIEADITNYFET